MPRVASEWDLDTPGARWREVDATLCFVDISGFTNLSERLARRGRIGAEELTEVLNRVFSEMLELAYDRGGALLKFGGDALLILFDGSDHPMQAACAAIEMRAALRAAAEIPTSVGRVRLRMSVGLHSGSVHLFRVGSLHHELVVTGPAATRTTQLESAASPGEILVGAETAARLPGDAARQEVGPGRLLRWRNARAAGTGTRARRVTGPGVIEQCLPQVLREHLRTGMTEFEHRFAAVAFVKFQGIDTLMATQGADAVAAALDELATTVQTAAQEEGVAFLATDIDQDGGKFILVSGVPRSREDDEGRLLRAVRRIADADTTLPLKIGVHRGHVFAGIVGAPHRAAFTVMGDTVNLAARLMSAAPLGEIYTTPSVLDRSRVLFEVTPIPPFMVKGKAQPVQAYAVGPESGTRSSTTRDEARFTGRTAELALLAESFAQFRLGSGLPVVVVGETGVGKSRLVREAVAAAELATFTVRGEPTGTTTPYSAFREPVRALLSFRRDTPAAMATSLRDAVAAIDGGLLPFVPLVAAVIDIDAGTTEEVRSIEPRFLPGRLADVMVRLFQQALPTPSAFVVDDAQWVDAASGELLARITDAAPTRSWQLIAVRRTGATGFEPANATRLEVGPLEDRELREIVVSTMTSVPLRPHEIEVLVRRASGSPLFLDELMRFARERGNVDDVPDSLDAVIATEIDSLAPLPRALLRNAAVLGLSFRPSVLREILADDGFEPSDLAYQQLEGFLTIEGDDAARFRHAVLRDAAYESLSYRRRRELHVRAGETIERVAGDDAQSEAENLSFHFFEGRDYERAWRYARLAAGYARDAYANVDAAAHYRRALEAARRLEAVPREELIATWIALGDALEQAGMLDDTLDAYRRASGLVGEFPVARAALLLKRARARERAGTFAAALRELTLAERLLGDATGSAAERARVAITTLRAIVREGQERPRQALDLARKAAAEAERLGERAELAKAYSVIDWAHVVLGEPERAVHAPLIVELHESLGETERAAGALGNQGAVAYWLGNWNEALDCYRRSEAAYSRIGDVVNAAIQQSNIGELLVSRGQYEEAAPVIADATRTHRAVGFVDGVLFDEIQLGRLLQGQGEHDGAVALLQAVCDQATTLHLSGTALHASIHLADCLLDQESCDEALAILADAERVAGEDAAVFTASVALVRARALATSGALEEAEEVSAAAVGDARRMGMLYELGLLLVMHADVSKRLGAGRPEAERSEGLALLAALEIRVDR